MRSYVKTAQVTFTSHGKMEDDSSGSEMPNEVSGPVFSTLDGGFSDVVNNIMAPSPTGASKHAMDAVIETYEETDHYDEAESWDALVFTEPPNKKLYCLLCNKIFREPMIMRCGHTFCRYCVSRKYNDGKCPVDKADLDIVVDNLAVADQIRELYVYCRYGTQPSRDGFPFEVNPTGCPLTIRISEKSDHEQDCQYAPVRCPNNPDCPMLKKRELEKHMKLCKHAKCPHHKYNCDFIGTAAELTEHLSECKFEAIKGFLHETEKNVGELQATVIQKDQEIGFLRSMLGKLSEKVEMLEKDFDLKLSLMETKHNDLVDEVRSDVGLLHQDMTDLHENMTVAGQVVGAFDPQQIFKCKGTFVGHQGPVWCLCVLQDFLFSGSSDKTIKVWDTSTTFKCLLTLEGHTGIVLALCVAGSKLYSGSQDTTIIVWDIEQDFARERTLAIHDNPVCTLAAARNMVFSGSLKTIKVWDKQEQTPKKEITGLNHWVRALVASQNYLYGGSYQTIKIWSLDTLECLRDLETSGGSVYSLAITSHHILCGTYENCIHVWKLGTFERVTTLMGHTGTVYALTSLNTPSGTKVFSASYDRSLRVRDDFH
ncbi:E3 ubiquitin-protein ligase TRAF7 [Lamellibrachia satsuma]|nr:E3 ubiquitin-protein ligase TRAF7 [Lamellibrachia satsuma]